ncbi:MAG: SDR family NAD(P)-dependent oxidoreductase [Betaproteobacteria bacterium]|nr:SDR family NAD(P)-dependent oxidoreductase [Betaproteobacteria bacterium]
MDRTPVALIVGVGEGLGFALGKRFARAGFRVALAARSAERLERLAAEIRRDGGAAVAAPTDARREEEVLALFDELESEHGPVEVAVYNAGANFRAPIVETPAEMFEKIWRLGCYGGFLFGREAARRMVPRGRGTILFTGATASLRGGAQFAAFAAAKNGLRAVAQSMARELGPKNVHVAHVVIDGMIDTQAARQRFPERAQGLGPEGMLAPDAIAELYYQLHVQPRSAWTFEADLRPWAEKF